MTPMLSEYSYRLRYSTILAGLLILEFLYQNPAPWTDPPISLSVYPMPFPVPFLLHFLPLLGVVGGLLWKKYRAKGSLSVRQGVGYVEPVIRYAGLALGLFVVGYSYAALAGFNTVLDGHWVPVLVQGALSALVTWLAGLSFALIGVGILGMKEALRSTGVSA